MNMLIIVAASLLSLGKVEVDSQKPGCLAAESESRAFAICRDGLATPFGTIPWNDVVRVRYFQRAAQKNYTGQLSSRVRIFSDEKVVLECFESETRAYIPVEVRFDGTWLRVSVEAGDIVEPLACNTRVTALEVLPTLLKRKNSSEGSYLLPLWGGAEVKLGQKERVTSVDRLYTHQAEWEKMGMINAFGLSTPSGSMLGVIDGGEFRAQVETSFDPEGDEASQVAVVGVRADPADMVEHERKEVLFRWIPNSRDYCGMALAWGEYLRGIRGLVPLTERMKERPGLEKNLTSLRFNIFMGMKQPFRTDGSGEYFSSTTFDEAGEIVDAARAAGIGRAWVCLVGWIKDGHDGAYPSHFPVNETAGGEKALRRLIAKIRALGWDVTPHDNVHSLYNASPDMDAGVASITRAGEIQPMGVWAGGMTNLACPQMWLVRYGGDYERIADLGFDGIYYIDALGTGLFRCHDPRHPANEREFALGQLRMLGWARARFGVSAVEMPQAYTLKYIDYGAAGASGERMWFASMMNADNKTLGDTWRLSPRPLPFFNVAAHGLIAIQGGWIHNYRAAKGGIVGMYVDGGVPAIEVCRRTGAIGDLYTDSLRDVAEPYRVYCTALPELVSGNAAAFEEYAPDAVHWTFDNGIEVFANASDSPAGGIAAGTVRILKNGQEVYSK